MEQFCREIDHQTVYPILIKYKGDLFLTLYYYTKHIDSVLHNDVKRILYFQSTNAMEAFCKRNDLQIRNEIVEYDFDAPIENPIDYTETLNKWNLLNTIANTFGMFFEGDRKKYTSIYNLLFRLNTPCVPIPSTYSLCEKDYHAILKVFRKKDRFLKLFEVHSEK